MGDMGGTKGPKPMKNIYCIKCSWGKQYHPKSISSQACKLCPMFYANKTLKVKCLVSVGNSLSKIYLYLKLFWKSEKMQEKLNFEKVVDKN